jgi:hypothetical protein
MWQSASGTEIGARMRSGAVLESSRVERRTRRDFARNELRQKHRSHLEVGWLTLALQHRRAILVHFGAAAVLPTMERVGTMPSFEVLATRTRWFLSACSSVILLGCAGDASSPTGGERTLSIGITLLQSQLEPLDSIAISAQAVRASGGLWPAEAIVWSTSDAAVATVSGGMLLGHASGLTTITASVGEVSTQSQVRVAWNSDARLDIEPAISTLELGGRVTVAARIRNRRPSINLVEWTSSNPAVVSISAYGVLTGIAAGVSTVTADFNGLTQSIDMHVINSHTGNGFGYAYTGDVPPLDDYDAVYLWSPSAELSYTTSNVAPSLVFRPPYPATVNFGWVREDDVWPTLMLHAVSLGGPPCQALIHTGHIIGPSFRCGTRMEAIAATSDAFTGTVALVRPGLTSVTTAGETISERQRGLGVWEYAVPDLERDDMYWFVTSASWWYQSVCSVAPASATPSHVTAVVACAGDPSDPAVAPHNAIGFATNATRSSEARVFAELDATGHVIRRFESGMQLTAALTPLGKLTVTLTGGRVASYGRAPAIFLTAVSGDAHSSCWMTQPVGVGTTSVTVDVTCDPQSEGVLFGAVY